MLFEECSDVCLEKLLQVFGDFYRNGIVNSIANVRLAFVSQKINETQICLIPKTVVFEIGDYMPISLLSSVYDLIAKVMSVRLCEVLGYYLRDRQILDAVWWQMS